MTPSPILMRGVPKRFDSKPVLDGLDWEVGPGQVIGLPGRNGAGKSTLMECLLGLREIDGGSVRLFGEPLDAPAMPAEAPRCNRMLARGLLRQGLTIWALVSATAVLMALVAGARGNALAASACMCCMTVPAMALALRDHARALSWSAVFYWLFAVGLSLIGPLAGAILFMAFGLPFWASATLASIVVAGLLVYRRLCLMEGAPFAFPAGRMD